MLSSHKTYSYKICLILIYLLLSVTIVFAHHPISSALYKLLEDGNIGNAKEAIAGYSVEELAALPDSVLLDYYYLKACIKDNEGDEKNKRVYLIAAKDICERSQGIHSPLYLELCWAIGKSFEESGDTVSAFETYQAALIQSRGFYKKDEDDVKWQYDEIENKVIDWYNNPILRNQMILHRDQLSPRDVSADAVQNDMEFYIRFYKDDPSKELMLKADSLYETESWLEAAKIYKELALITENNPIAKATLQELSIF